ncbi:MAG: hypothetical protein FJ368_06760 [Pelagibacterales bacterium]|nr:hypothetical protein [Pelagibacterales bacterium]
MLLKKIKNIITKIFLTSIILLVIVVFIIGPFTSKNFPSEAKFLMDYLKTGERLDDIVSNPEKYKKEPCFKLEFDGHKYCFDNSKALFHKRYEKGPFVGGEDVVLYFIPKALLQFPQQNKSIRIDWEVDEYYKKTGKNIVERMIHYRNRNPKAYYKMLSEVKEGKFINVDKYFPIREEDTFNRGNKIFIYAINGQAVMSLVIEPSNKYFKFISSVTYKNLEQNYVISFHLVSNQQTEKEFLNTILEITKEFSVYAENSKIN